MKTITIDPSSSPRVATRKTAIHKPPQQANAQPTRTTSKSHSGRTSSQPSNASLYFIGTATTLLRYGPLTILTDPNFLSSGDTAHLGPGVTATRLTNPAISMAELPPIDLVLLSHYHADHFDEIVQDALRRDIPIITTSHAREQLVDKLSEGEKFEDVIALDTWEEVEIVVKGNDERMRVRAMPGSHVPPGGVVEALNDWVGAVPPTNGWMIELGGMRLSSAEFTHDRMQEFYCGYRMYVSGDTLLVDGLKEIADRYKAEKIDLSVLHLGGTTIPSKALPLLTVTMDGRMGLEVSRLIDAEVTIPIHYDDYDVFLSPLEDFRKAVDEAGVQSKVVHLARAEQYDFAVRSASS